MPNQYTKNPPKPLAERVLARIEKTGPNGTGCWLWRGERTPKGYARYEVSKLGGRHVRLSVHRYMYESHIGPIPDGLQLDHLCRTHHCVNPSHLEPVTNRENQLRGLNGRLRNQTSDGDALPNAASRQQLFPVRPNESRRAG